MRSVVVCVFVVVIVVIVVVVAAAAASTVVVRALRRATKLDLCFSLTNVDAQVLARVAVQTISQQLAPST